MNTEDQVVDTIDALVDAQLQQEASGYDWNINQAQCPHPGCAYDEWHGLKLYGCPGSAVHGPVEPRRGRRNKVFIPAPGSPITGADPHEDLCTIPPAEVQFPRGDTLYDSEWNRIGAVRNLKLTIVPTPEDVREAWDRLAGGVTTVVRQLEVTFRVVGEQLREIAAFFDLPDVDGGEVTPQQRALPRPSHTPPMWANNPTRSRRKR